MTFRRGETCVFALIGILLTSCGQPDDAARDAKNLKSAEVISRVSFLRYNGEVYQLRFVTRPNIPGESDDYSGLKALERLRFIAKHGGELELGGEPNYNFGPNSIGRMIARFNGLVNLDAISKRGRSPLESFSNPHWTNNTQSDGFYGLGKFSSGGRSYIAASYNDCTEDCTFEDKWTPLAQTPLVSDLSKVSSDLENCVIISRYVVCDIPDDIYAVYIEDQTSQKMLRHLVLLDESLLTTVGQSALCAQGSQMSDNSPSPTLGRDRMIVACLDFIRSNVKSGAS